jgi:hypothetical protein
MVDATAKQDETVDQAGAVPSAAPDSGPADTGFGADSDTAAGESDSARSDATEARPKRGRPRKSAAAKSPGVELVLTVTGTAEATDWQAEVTHGGKRVVKGLPVPATAVAAAAKDLHPDVAEAIESVLNAARDRQRSRVEQLQAELEVAQRALADLQAD